MRNRLFFYLYLAAVGLMVVCPTVRAAAPDACWGKVALDSDTPVKLVLDSTVKSRLDFRANIEVGVQVQGVSETLLIIPEKTEVILISSTGKVIIKNGPLELIKGHGHYAIPDSTLVLQNLKLSAVQGTKINLPVAVTDGKLPANTNAEIVFDDGIVDALLTAPVYLSPKQPAEFSAVLNPGVLPITRGGRTLRVDLYVPGLNKDQLEGEKFQACFYEKATDAIDSSGASVRATMASVINVQYGKLTLVVPVPDEFDRYTWLWNSVQLQILGPTLGVLSNEQEVYISNPVLAFLGSIAIVAGLLLWIASRLPSADIGDGIVNKLLSFTIGVDGQTSLSLFQIYIWTTLVLTGMVYVFFMSGNLLNVSQQVLVLVGLAGGGSISARWISIGTVSKSASEDSGFWGMFVVNGTPDLLRLQLFLFTLTIWIYVAARVFYEQEFPELTANVLLLMGISNGVYVGAKWVTSSDPSALLRQKKAYMARDIKKLEAGTIKLTDPVTQQAKIGSEQELKKLKETLKAKKKELDAIKAEINQVVKP